MAPKIPEIEAKQTTKRGIPHWVVDLSVRLTGKRVRIFRLTREEAEAAAWEYLSERQLHGGDLSTLTTMERTFILWLRERGIGVEVAQRILSDAPTTMGPMLENAHEEYLRSQKGNDAHHLSSIKSKLRIFRDGFPGRRVGSIRPGEVERWLRPRGRGRLAYWRVLRAFFNFAAMHDWTDANPILKIPRPAVVPDEKIIFTAEQMERLLTAAQDLENLVMLRFLVFGGFFGLRTKEILSLQAEDVTPSEVHVRNMKTQKRGLRERYVTVLPVAKKWLPLLQLPKSGPVIGMTDKNFRINREKVLTKAGEGGQPIGWPYNVLRRSFGSYHLAAYEDPGKTAAQMGHTDPETTIGKYRAVRRKADGLAWFRITP